MELILIAVVLGIVQGLTEFLPVSSSGHLVIFQFLFKIENIQLLLSVAVHFGTLLAVIIFFYRDLLAIVSGFFSGIAGLIKGQHFRSVLGENEHFKLSLLIILANIPAGILGLTLKDQLEETFSSIILAGCMLLITALFLFLTRFIKPVQDPPREFSWGTALIIGLAQAIALLPGISRSGATISTALFLRVEREWAARFSFILSVPAVFGAFCLELGELAGLGTQQLLAVVLGIVSAGLVGYAALIVLMKIVVKGSFYKFAYYCCAVGLLAIGLGLFLK